ncbi:hypothetical protein DUNSADRAFT_7440 [Dunaliella salina]|uniref:Transmembrane protein 186 n=1 Tax=Dunaliella salina TaxID=3046 RepID=A0ABQ7GLB8_DUNSA|nr:hypothetical protein DUNSADRAFT_7440 [Dunaliella salina]|eukprot:KAF5835405.1 hypothetical protein DUNSADRAFT_7440 [Dunaliella salina]
MLLPHLRQSCPQSAVTFLALTHSSRMALGSPASQSGSIPAYASSSCLSTSAACASNSPDEERKHSNGAASSSKPQSAMDVVKRRLGLQVEGMSFHLPNSPFKNSRLGPPVPKLVLYRGRGMLPFRFLVRAKVFQLLGFMTSAVMLTTVAGTQQALSPTDIAVGTSVIVGCIVTSYCLWFYSGRYVGELSLLLPSKRVARFSVLDFWGNREDNDIPIEAIDPPFYNRNVAEVKSIVSQRLMPITVIGDRQYYISPRHGYVLQKDVLNKICYGKWLEELDGKIPGTTHTSSATSTPSSLPSEPPLEKGSQ